MADEEEKDICCCRVSCCTKFVALIQIVFGAVAGSLLTLALTALLNVPHLPLLVGTSFVQVGCDIAEVIMGIVLLISAYMRSTRFIDAWTIMAVIFFVLDTICTVLSTVAHEMMVTDDSAAGSVVVLIVKMLGMAAMFRFKMYVVQTFKSDIEDKENADNESKLDI